MPSPPPPNAGKRAKVELSPRMVKQKTPPWLLDDACSHFFTQQQQEAYIYIFWAWVWGDAFSFGLNARACS